MRAFILGLALGLFGVYYGTEIMMAIRELSPACHRDSREIASQKVRTCVQEAACIWGRF